jgi:beta-lactamase regulating signal transducer with metallopeptidase domain
MTAMIDSWTWWAATTLGAASLQGTLTVAVVWLVCRRLKAMSAAMRALVWWVAALGFVLALTPLPSLRIPLLPGPALIVAVPVAPMPSSRALETAAPIASQTNSVHSEHTSRTDRGTRPWAIAAMVLWMAVVATHLVRLVRAYARLRAVVRRSTPLAEGDREAASRIGAALGLKQLPAIRVSGEIETPFVAGLPRTIVLIPASAIASLSSHERAMAIGHELAHVRRRDLLLAWVPAMAERLFFFHPLARLASREYAAERESACDALVLDSLDVAPHDYGRMLVRLGIAAANPVLTMGGSPSTVSSLRRRLDMLHDATSARSSRATFALVALIALVAVLPLRVVARTQASAQTAAAPAGPATPQTPARPVQTAKPQPAAPASPAAPADRRPVARANAPESESVDKAIAEQRRKMQEIEQALIRMRSDLQALYTQDREARLEQERRQVESIRRAFEQSQLAQRLQESAVRQTETQTTTQFLESELRALTAEHEETSARLRRLSEEIDSIRKKIDEARLALEIESKQKRGDDKK